MRGRRDNLRFHYLKPSLNCFLNIRNRLVVRFPLRKATWQGRDFCYVIACFIFFYGNVQFQRFVLLVNHS